MTFDLHLWPWELFCYFNLTHPVWDTRHMVNAVSVSPYLWDKGCWVDPRHCSSAVRAKLMSLSYHYYVCVFAGKHKANKGWGALHLASYFGHTEVVKFLIEVLHAAQPSQCNAPYLKFLKVLKFFVHEQPTVFGLGHTTRMYILFLCILYLC